MPRRKEIPFDPTLGDRLHGAHGAAQTEMAAIMQAAPNDVIQPSREELLPLRDVLADAIDTVLTDRERWIFDACVIERKSIRAVAAELSLAKSHVDRMKHRACQKLRDALVNEPIIVMYLTRGATLDGNWPKGMPPGKSVSAVAAKCRCGRVVSEQKITTDATPSGVWILFCENCDKAEA